VACITNGTTRFPVGLGFRFAKANDESISPIGWGQTGAFRLAGPLPHPLPYNESCSGGPRPTTQKETTSARASTKLVFLRKHRDKLDLPATDSTVRTCEKVLVIAMVGIRPVTQYRLPAA